MKRGGGHSKRLRKSFEASIRQGYGVGLYRRDAFPTVSTLYVDETRFTTWPSFSAERSSASLGFSDFNLYFIPSLWIFTRMPPIYVYGAELLCEYDSSRFIKNHWMNGFFVMDERVEMFYRSSIERKSKMNGGFFLSLPNCYPFFFFNLWLPFFIKRNLDYIRLYKKKVIVIFKNYFEVLSKRDILLFIQNFYFFFFFYYARIKFYLYYY